MHTTQVANRVWTLYMAIFKRMCTRWLRRSSIINRRIGMPAWRFRSSLYRTLSDVLWENPWTCFKHYENDRLKSAKGANSCMQGIQTSSFETLLVPCSLVVVSIANAWLWKQAILHLLLHEAARTRTVMRTWIHFTKQLAETMPCLGRHPMSVPNSPTTLGSY